VIFAENWFLVQYEDQPDTLRVLSEQEVKHLDSEDEEDMQEGETIMAYWSADKSYYEAQLLKISDDKNELLKKRRSLEMSIKSSSLGKALSCSSKRPKSPKKQKPAKKAKLACTDDEKAKKEDIKKRREAEKVEAEKKRKAEIAAKIAQATKRISHEQSRDDLQCNDDPQESNCSTSLPEQITVNGLTASPSSTGSPSPKETPVHVYGAQKKPKKVTTNTVDSPPSSLSPVLNSGKTPAHAGAKKNTKRTITGTANSPSSSNSAVDGKVSSQETPTHGGAKKKATGDRSTPKVSARQHKNIRPMVISDDEEEDIEMATILTTCDSADCQALLQENKILKDKLKKLQRKLDIAGMKFKIKQGI